MCLLQEMHSSFSQFNENNTTISFPVFSQQDIPIPEQQFNTPLQNNMSAVKNAISLN